MNNFFKSVINKSGIYYTISVAIFSIIMLFSNSTADTVSMDPSRILLFLPFCICFAIANTVLKYQNVEAFTRWLIHSVLTIGSAFLFIILPADLETSSGNFMGIVFIIVAYLIGVLFIKILSSRVKKTLIQDKELKSK